MKFYSAIYPPGISPARPGLYLTTSYSDWNFICLHRWDGANWYDSSGAGGFMHIVGNHASGQNRYWRGLAAQTNEGPT